jgi:hypothetical protein
VDQNEAHVIQTRMGIAALKVSDSEGFVAIWCMPLSARIKQ